MVENGELETESDIDAHAVIVTSAEASLSQKEEMLGLCEAAGHQPVEVGSAWQACEI